MREKFSIASFLVAAAAAILIWGAGLARAADVQVNEGAPSRYTVQKGDTLWGIAAKFLKDPWRWPDVWRMNREQIRNPHLIYPGDVIVLDRAADGGPRLSLERPTTRLSPSVRSSPLDVQAIPSIPAGDIEPYLTRPLITGPNGLQGSAEIIAGRDARYSRGDGDVAYVVGIDPKAGDLWSIYRQGREFRSLDTNELLGVEQTYPEQTYPEQTYPEQRYPEFRSLDTNELLGVEQRYLGAAKVERFAEVSTLRIVTANEEILIGDRLIPAPRGALMNYVPHAPGRPVDGRIIALNSDLATEAGRGSIVTLDKGTSNGVDVGTVLAIYRVVPPIADPRPQPEQIDPNGGDPTRFFTPVNMLHVPDERSGLLFVFRVFDRVSYAILLNQTNPVFVGDYVRNP